MAEAILSGIALGYCAFIVFIIGFVQYKSKKPVGFYTGEKPLKAEQISDVSAWNRCHGRMWMLYSGVLVLVWVCGLFIGDSLWLLLPFFGGVCLPVPVMIWYHHRLLRKYFVKKPSENS